MKRRRDEVTCGPDDKDELENDENDNVDLNESKKVPPLPPRKKWKLITHTKISSFIV